MIHSTAIIDPSAILHEGVQIGPYSIIGSNVEIGKDTEIQNNVTIQGPTVIGPRCRVFPYAAIGLDPQDKKYNGGESRLRIGKENVIREFVTINRGTEQDNIETVIGDRAWIMAYSHIAHDCIVGDDVIFANHTTLGGHVKIGNFVVAGGHVAIHQFCSIGNFVMIGGCSAVTVNIPPFLTVNGQRVNVMGINKIGLERNGISKEEIKEIYHAYKVFYKNGLQREEALKELNKSNSNSPYVLQFINFIQNSERPICR